MRWIMEGSLGRTNDGDWGKSLVMEVGRPDNVISRLWRSLALGVSKSVVILSHSIYEPLFAIFFIKPDVFCMFSFSPHLKRHCFFVYYSNSRFTSLFVLHQKIALETSITIYVSSYRKCELELSDSSYPQFWLCSNGR